MGLGARVAVKVGRGVSVGVKVRVGVGVRVAGGGVSRLEVGVRTASPALQAVRSIKKKAVRAQPVLATMHLFYHLCRVKWDAFLQHLSIHRLTSCCTSLLNFSCF